MPESELNAFRQDLTARVKGDVAFDPVTLSLYATDASIYQITPTAVVMPRDQADVIAAVNAATDHRVAVLPRGGGTSLGGQAVGPAMVIDFSKYMNNILELNVAERWVRVQPGIVLDDLNAVLAPHGLHFAPDPATSSRATIGGMMGNNSSGTKSIKYGITRDHVRAGKILLADGTILDLEELSSAEYARRSQGHAREAQILTGVKTIINTHRDEIEKRFPKVMRRVQGYNLDAFIHTDRWNLMNLLVGSEGTLGVTLEAKLNLEPLPKCKALCVVHFADLLESIRTVAPILRHNPSAVEILDADVIVRARQNLNLAPLCGFLQGDPLAVLIVEFFGDTADDVARQAHALAAHLQARQLGYTWPVVTEPAEQANVWAVRKNGLGLMLGIKGDRKPLPFIEDSAIPIEHLPQYIDEILTFCKQRDVPVAMYAHASVGTIHVRPILNLKDQTDIDNMKAIADYAFERVVHYGGAFSGEHGDGRVRSAYLKRYFGPNITRAFRDVKHLFDPAGLMNPGPIVDPPPIDRDLRYGAAYRTPPIDTEYHYREDGSFAAAVEMCNGVGACRQNLLATMCPSYRATRDEAHCTRGRANALRLAMSNQLGPDGLTRDDVHRVFDLCLSCKACKAECPSNVDLARLKSEFLKKYHDRHGTGLRERIVARSPDTARKIAGPLAAIVNRIQNAAPFRYALHTVVGFDRRRRLPDYARVPLTAWFANRPTPNGQADKAVVLFDDTYMTYHDTAVGISAVELLESCGYRVILANAGCCQRPKISHGLLRDAKLAGEKTLRNLDTYIRQGLPIVVCEPGCCSALTDDLPDLIDDEPLSQRIKDNVTMIDTFLFRELQAGRLTCTFTSDLKGKRLLIHGHCHQKALYGTTAMKHLLDQIDDLTVTEIDAGCCGMAGSFGYETEHYDISLQIGEDRLFPAIRNAGPDTTVIACGFSCRHQITHATNTPTAHWVQTLRATAPTPAGL